MNKLPVSIHGTRKLAGAFIAIAFTVLAPSAFAADQFFSNAGGPLTWDTATSNWGATTGGPYTSLWTSGNKAILEGTAGTVNVGTGGNPTVGAIQFSVTGYTLTGGQITLGANASISAFGTTEINSVIGETGGARDLSFTGNGARGTLILGGANTYTGNTKLDYTNVSFSNLQNGGTASSFGSGTGSVSATNGSSFGTVTYTGAGGSTDRAWLTSGTGGAFLNNNGSGAISFNNTGSAFGGTAGARHWILGGTYTASSNRFAGLLNDTGTGANISRLTVNTKWAFTNNNTYTGVTTIGSNGIMQIADAGSLVGSDGNHTAITLSGVNSTLQYSSSADSTLGGVISGAGKLTKDTSSSSVLTLTNENTYSGATTVSAGTLILSGTGSINNSAVTINGGTFRNNSSTDYTGALTFTSGTIGGTNLTGVALSIGIGQTISPGNSPGTMTTAGQTWIGGGTYDWEINNATGVQGTNWDFIDASGALDITALSSGSKFNINIIGLTAGDVSGAVPNWSDTNQSWKIASFAGISGTFAENLFNVDASGFTNNNSASGTFGVSNIDNDLYVTYVIPEPATWVLLALSLTTVMVLGRRRNS